MIARYRRSIVGLATVAMVMGTLSTFAPAAAATTIGAFEVDGNLVDSNIADGIYDWDTLSSLSDAVVVEFVDPTGNADNSFGGGSKELDPTTWSYVSQSVPQKDDLLETGIATREVDGEDWLYIYSRRQFGKGAAFIGYEFNQSNGTFDNDNNAATPEVARRSNGDLLVLLIVTEGGTQTQIDVFVWNGTHTAGSWDPSPLSPTRGTDWEAVTDNPSGTFLLSEGALRLSAFGNTPSCPGLGQAWVHTISSHRFGTATMKDRTDRHNVALSDCGSVTVHKIDDQEGGALDGATFELRRDGGPGDKPDGIFMEATDPQVGTCVTGSGGAAGECTFEEVGAGSYWLREIAAPDGYAIVDGSPRLIQVDPGEHVEIDEPYVNRKLFPKFEVEKTVDPGTVDLSDGDLSNDTLTYTLTVTNVGEAAGSTAVEDDYDQNHLTDVALITAGGTNNGDVIRWDDSGTIAPNGGTAVFEYTARVTGTFGEDVRDDGCADAFEYPVVNQVSVLGDSASATACVRAKPDLKVTKTADAEVVQIGEQVTYTITVTNHGQATGSTAVSDDYDQDHLTGITGIDPASGIDTGDVIAWPDSGPIPAGESAEFSYSGTVADGFEGPSGTGGCDEGHYPVLNMVQIAGDRTANTICVPAAPKFTISKTASPTSVDLHDGTTANDIVTYTITVSNIGNAAGSTIVTDDYDQDHLIEITGVTPANGSNDGDTIVWETASIPAGGSAEFTYSGRIVGGFTGAPGGGECEGTDTYPVVNTASIPDHEASATVCVKAGPKFRVKKIADPTVVDLTDDDQTNDTVTYTITVSNVGQAEGSTDVVDDYDQDHLTDIDNLDPAHGVDDGFTITWLNVGPIAPGDAVTLSYTGRITGEYSGEPEGCDDGRYPVVNVVTVRGDTHTATVCVIAEPDFDVEKTVEPAFVDLSDDDTSNDTVTYSITVTNNGAAAGSTGVVDDYDQDHLTDIDDITPADGNDDGDLITWDSGTIAPNGGVAQFSYTARITGDYTGEPGRGCEGDAYGVLNQVTVTGDSDTETVCVTAVPKFSVVKTANPTTVDLSDDDTSNDTVTYTITVTNSGAAEGSTSVVDNYAENHLVNLSGITPGAVDDGSTLTWDSGVIAPNGGTAQFSYSGTVEGPFTSEEADPERCEGVGIFPVLNIVTVAGDEATEVVCVQTGPDFTVNKSADPTSIDLSDGDDTNDVVTYTITATNNGSGPGSTFVTDDYDENHLTEIADITPADGVDDGSMVSWADSGSIQPGASAEFSFSARVVGPFTSAEADPEACEGDNRFPVVNRVSVDGSETTSTICVNAAPRLVVAKTADATTAQLGEEVSYTITVQNNGQGPGSTTVTDNYDQAHLEVDGTTIDPVTGVDDGDTITWASSGVIEPNEQAVFTYTGTLIGSFTGPSGGRECDDGSFPVLNTVTIVGDETSYTVCVPAEPQFTVTKSADPAAVNLSDGDTSNDTVTYTLTVENIGDAEGVATAVDDFDQDHLIDINDGGGTVSEGIITFTSDVIPAGGTRTFTYSGRVVGPFTSDEAAEGCEGEHEFPVLNLVEVFGEDGESDDSASATVCVNAEPRLETVKTADPTSVDLSDGDDTNDVVTYTIIVRNVGEGPGSMTVVDDYDQNHFEPTSILPASGQDDGDTVTWQSGTIEPGDEANFSLAGRVFGPYGTEEAGPQCEGQDEFPLENVVVGTDARALVCVHAAPHLLVEKSARNLTDGGEFAPTAAGEPGESIEYRIVVTNDGASTATGVQASDTVPAGMSFVSCEPALSCSENGGTVTWDVGILLAGQDSGPLTMVVLIEEGFQPGFTRVGNVASATRDGGEEPEPSNPVDVTVTELSKHVCTSNPIPGAAIEYTIPYGAHGGDVHGVVLEDVLPEHVEFESASPAPTSAPAVGETGAVRWELGTLTDGTVAGVTIRGRISLDASAGDVLENVVTLSAEGVPPTSFTLETEVIEDGEAAANAQGFYVDVLGNEIGPMLDSDEENPDAVLDVEDPISGDYVQAEVLEVSEGESVDKTNATSNAVATAAAVRVLDLMAGPGENWLVSATAIRAVSSSNADLATAGSSSAGSVLEGVTVGGKNYGTISEPTTVEVVLPGGLLTARVDLLEEISTGAADGVVQPDGGTFASGLTVIGIHVTVTNSSGDVVTEVFVSRAQSEATFLSGLACGEELPRVSGTGYALGVTTDETLVDPNNTLAFGEAARVRIPITGGEDSSTQEHVGPIRVAGIDIVESNTAYAHSLGVVDRDAGSGVADTEAGIEQLGLIERPGGYRITADAIRSEVHAEATGPETASATGSTTLASLVIDGTDVCDSLGLETVCTPEPNTTIQVGNALLVILNEQIEGPSGPGVASLTVNAVHIFVVGQDNPFNLPAGAEIVISSSHAGAHAEGGMVLPEEGGESAAAALPDEPGASSDGPSRPTLPVRPVPEAVKPSAPELAVPEEATEGDADEAGESKGLLGGWFGLF